MPPRAPRAALVAIAVIASFLGLVLASSPQVAADIGAGAQRTVRQAPGVRKDSPPRVMVGGTCQTCPNYDYPMPNSGCLTPTGVWVEHESSTSGSGDCNWYCFNVVAGLDYEFNTCTPPTVGPPFDTLLNLTNAAGCGVLASNDDACGVQSSILWNATFTGQVRLEVRGFSSNFGSYVLAYRSSACAPPTMVTTAPPTADTTAEDCTRNQTFTVTTDGTGPFDIAWEVVPSGTNTADPSTGVILNGGATASFSSLLQGTGTYTLLISSTGDCGTVTGGGSFVLGDARGPELTTTAVAAACSMPAHAPAGLALAPSASPQLVAKRLSAIGRDDLHALVFGTVDPDVAAAALAEKLGIAKSLVRVIDGTSDARYQTPPGAAAVGCGTPCTSGTITAENTANPLIHNFYDVALSCNNGAFTARTGDNHPDGAGLNVIFGGTGLNPGTSDVTFHEHVTNTNYLDPTTGAACVFDPSDTPGEPENIGIEMEWAKSPTAGMDLILREEIVTFGTAANNSGVRLTLGATNLASSTLDANMGVRWQIDYQNGIDDGPGYARVICDPFQVIDERFTEHEYPQSEIDDFYRIQNNAGTPIFANYSSTTTLPSFPGTGTPDRLVYGRWGPLSGSGWNYMTNEGANADSDSAVLYYHGYLPADGIVLAPGESFSRSLIIFTAANAQDCGAFVEGACTDALVTICQGSCATIGATAVDNCGDAEVRLVSSTFGAPPCVGNPCTIQFPDLGTYIYTWEAEDDAGNIVTCTSTVQVDVSAGDVTPPTVFGYFEPAAPQGPASPQSASSACSAPTSGTFAIRCGVVDECDPNPTLTARLLVSHTQYLADGSCQSVVEPLDVQCDDVVELRLVARPCAPAGPSSPGSPNSAPPLVDSGISGEAFLLEVIGMDSSGNTSDPVTADPTTVPDPCPNPLPDGSCCPAMVAPESACPPCPAGP